MSNSYFEGPLPHRLAHRGATGAKQFDENTLEAFRFALELGATHLETDVRATKDGKAVLFHDPTLTRMTSSTTLPPITARVGDLTWQELEAIALARGGRVITLRQALESFPEAKFNIDIKSRAAIAPVTAILAEMAKPGQILITSFSDRRRKLTTRRLAQLGFIASTSAGAGLLLRSYLTHATVSIVSDSLASRAVSWLLRNVDAMQMPAKRGPLRFDSPGFIKAIRQAGKHLHFWVINDPDQARQLVSRGASGIVTDDLSAISSTFSN